MEIKRSKMEGSSLIEVMVSLFVFAIGILGVLSMQAQSVKLNNNAFLYSKANIIAMEMVEHLKASPVAANAFTLGLETCNASTEDCCEEGIADGWAEAATWLAGVTGQLPGGQGSVVRNGNGVVEVVVCFNSGVNEATEELTTGVVNLAASL